MKYRFTVWVWDPRCVSDMVHKENGYKCWAGHGNDTGVCRQIAMDLLREYSHYHATTAHFHPPYLKVHKVLNGKIVW